MIKRIIEVSNKAYLSLKDFQLVIKKEDSEHKIPLEDVGVIVIESWEVSISQRLLVEIAHQEITLLICDEKHLPVWLYHAFSGHTQSAKYLINQVNISQVARKQLWQRIIQSKIKNQWLVLDTVWKDWTALKNIASEVKSNDSDNREWFAANIYWKLLFWEDFNRRKDWVIINTMLNYGYALLRASIARWVVSSWLHPSLGIFHSNQFNAFNLVDDLIEPFRPLVDKIVIEILSSVNTTQNPELTPEIKRKLLEILAKDIIWNWQKLPILVAINYYTSSFRDWLEDINSFIIPQIFA
jgi:CRISP-associated protein Cas1